MSDPVEAGRVEGLAVEGVGFQGEGWARLEALGFLSIPHAWPGDVVDVRHGAPRRGRAWAEVVAWRARSPERVDPACADYDRCSGCALRHVALERELAWKASEACAILARYAPSAPPVELDVVDAGVRSGHRARGRFACAVEGGAVRLGLRAITLEREILDLRGCPAQSARFLEVIQALGAALDAAPAVAASLRAVEVRTGADAAALACLAVEADPAAAAALEALATAALAPLGVRVALEIEGEEAAEPPPSLPIALSGWGVTVQAPRTSWVHATPACGEAMVGWVVSRLGGRRRAAALDLCAGVGTVTAHLAQRAARVLAVDADHRGLAALQAAAHEAGAAHVQTRAGRAEVILRKLRAAGERGLEVAVINPMRLPLGAATLEHLAPLGVREIIYLGPAAVSAAKDLEALHGAGYLLQRAAVLNLHPGTAHFMLGLHLRWGDDVDFEIIKG